MRYAHQLMAIAKCVLCVVLFAKSLFGQASVETVIADAIQTVRPVIDYRTRQSVSLSADGRTAAFVVRHADLARDVNVYRLFLFDVGEARRTRVSLVPLMQVDQSADDEWTPFAELRVCAGAARKPVATFLHGKAQQVVAVGMDTKKLVQLTHHPGPVRIYGLNARCTVRIYAAVADDSSDRSEQMRLARLRQGGFVTSDTSVFRGEYLQRPFGRVLELMEVPTPKKVWQYFVSTESGASPQRIYDSREARLRVTPGWISSSGARQHPYSPEWDASLQGYASLSVSPDGKRALFWPYARTSHDMRGERYDSILFWANKTASYRIMAQPFGLIDLVSREIDPLLDAPSDLRAYDLGLARPIWRSDGGAVAVINYLPLSAGNEATERVRAGDPAGWIEIDVVSKVVTPLNLSKNWQPLSWDAATGLMIVGDKRSGSFARMRRFSNRWSALELLGRVTTTIDTSFVNVGEARFELAYGINSNGFVALGVVRDTNGFLELGHHDFSSQSTDVLTTFNVDASQRHHANGKPFSWNSVSGNSTLYLPRQYRGSTRVPVVIINEPGLITDEIPALTSVGIAVLNVSFAGLGAVANTPGEGNLYVVQLEQAIRALIDRGIADSSRIALTGFSRGGFITDWLLIHSPRKYAAAATIDGGGTNYVEDAGRAWTPDELKNVQTPLLIHAHGPRSLLYLGVYADALASLGKAVEVLWFPTATHNLRTPKQRWRTHTVRVDWFRFWLQDYEDLVPAKKEQYQRWRKFKTIHQ